MDSILPCLQQVRCSGRVCRASHIGFLPKDLLCTQYLHQAGDAAEDDGEQNGDCQNDRRWGFGLEDGAEGAVGRTGVLSGLRLLGGLGLLGLHEGDPRFSG